ncbi:hypothetical protein M0L20_28515 [Spirosoma sp. RP8]|uniref:Uncharacterized protein n=1 Tax=Spirosoma liriopis TaxID=2937440 RepID=A0ABT0HUF5_9BACT|nr:hypothetical protein [Spirosoma liriopis]MCK8495843.1 hypothetical protein [Spirosoma liriopis]
MTLPITPPNRLILDTLRCVQESEPDPLYQTPSPDPAPDWRVGDLVRQTDKLILIIAVGAER